MRHIGILAHSAPGSAQCFQAIARYGDQHLGVDQHPDVTLDCIAMGRSMPAWRAGDHDAVREILAESVRRLGRAGCDFFICPDNTAHLALDRPGPDLALPGLHLARVVARQAAAAGHQRVAVLGTRWTMEAPLYPEALAVHGVQTQIPGAEDREVIQQITFDELVKGVFREAARARFGQIIATMRDRGCDAVALVCTEFPLLVTPESSPLPTLDSTDLLARAALTTATEGRGLPAWRGGPSSSP